MGDPVKGMKLYKQYCQVCHGEEGDGIMAKLMKIELMDHTNFNEMDRLTNEELVESILTGTGRFMLFWKDVLTRAEVEVLVSYVRLSSH